MNQRTVKLLRNSLGGSLVVNKKKSYVTEKTLMGSMRIVVNRSKFHIYKNMKKNLHGLHKNDRIKIYTELRKMLEGNNILTLKNSQ